MKRILLFSALVFSLAAHSQNLIVQNGASFIAAGTPTLVLNNMGLDAALNTTDLQNANLVVGGSGNCLLKNASAFINLQKLTVDKPGGILAIANDVQVYKGVQMVNGLFDLGAKNLYLSSNSLLTGESETARITSSSTGFIQTVVNLSNSSNLNAGGMGMFITSAANAGLVVVRRGHKPQTGNGLSASISRYYDFNPANTALNATLKFTYFDAELNGQPEAGLQMLESTNSGTSWATKTTLTKDAAINYVVVDGLNSLYRYALGTATNAPLPVTLTAFTAQCKGSFVQLNWKTASEANSDRFDVQRSANGSVWEKIGSVRAAGNSTTMLAYQYDDNATPSSSFYRLAQYDLNGKLTYSAVVKGDCTPPAEFKVLPNPVSTTAKIIISAISNGEGSLQLFNAAGQRVMYKELKLSAGINQQDIDLSTLASGQYQLLFVQNGAVRQTVKITKQ